MRGPTMTHDNVDELLPLLVSGGLTDAESRAVQEHVATCLVCRREQKHLALVNAGLQSAPAGVDVPAPDAARLLERIDAHEERRRDKPFARLITYGRQHPLFALAAQAALVLLAVLVFVSPIEQEPAFTTLSQPDELPAGEYVRAVFEPGLDETDVADLVASMQLRIVDGPGERGIYTLAVSARSGLADYDTLAEALRANDNVLFAESISIGGVQ